jgi:hypothetical protein
MNSAAIDSLLEYIDARIAQALDNDAIRFEPLDALTSFWKQDFIEALRAEEESK